MPLHTAPHCCGRRRPCNLTTLSPWPLPAHHSLHTTPYTPLLTHHSSHTTPTTASPLSLKGTPPPRAAASRHAVTDDPTLKRWTVLTLDAPLLGISERAPDGVENVAVFRGSGGGYVMVYSEGLASQVVLHL